MSSQPPAIDLMPSSAGARAPETSPASAGPTSRALNVLIVTPTLHAGAADAGAVQLARILVGAGHRPIVVANGGRMTDEVIAAGASFVPLNVASTNPAIMIRNAFILMRLIRAHRCDVIHAHARAPAWSAYVAARRTGIPFLTSWYKGFREQNMLKHFYNGVMARGDRVVAISEQIADLVVERYHTPADRISIVPASVDFTRFDPGQLSDARIAAIRAAWGAPPEARVILVVGRMLRRKGHHVVVDALRRLRDMGLKDFVCVFVGEDQGRSRYTGELWDMVLSTGMAEVIRLAGATDDLPAALAAATVVVNAAIQPEGLQRAVLEAEAMARPVVVSDLGAGPDAVLAPPAVAEDRITGLRFSAGDSVALATALVRLFSLPAETRNAIGTRGRAWVLAHFNDAAAIEPTLRLYREIAGNRRP